LTIICVCLRVIIIIMTVVNDGPYTHNYFNRRSFYPGSWCRTCIH
jgi:hypothetical protein